VLPREGAHFPVTEDRQLARIAEAGEECPELWHFVNRLPTIRPDGIVTNPFQNVYFIESVKNFAFYDDTDELVFMLYKSAEGAFNVKAKSPFTPLTAFALSLGIIFS
jgi:hypothetical protein